MPVEKCLAWTALAGADAGQLDALLADKFAGLRRERHVVPELGSWWVFIPPLPNKAEADKKSGELKRLGRGVLRDPGRRAEPLGDFARHLLQRAGGERPARVLA